MIYKVGILGASGRMGQEMAALLTQGFSVGSDTLEFSDAVAQTTRISYVDTIPVRKLADPPREPVHVWIDFSRPEGTLELLKTIREPIVIGTTGFSDSELEAIRLYSEKHPVLMTSNTSPGMNFMMKMLKAVPVSVSLGYDVVASELHHRQKKDAPSGTLKSLLKILESQGHRQIQVQHARVGDEKGTHSIAFYSDDEELILTHRVTNRRVFARGALWAAHFLAKKREPGFYSFDSVEVL